MRRYGLRGLSPYVSALLLALIVLVAGSMVLIYAISAIDVEYQRISRELIETELVMKQALAVAASYIDAGNGVVRVFAATGEYPVELLGVYVNDTLVECTVYVDGAWNSLPTRIPPYTIAVVECPVGSASSATVRLVYEGGEAETIAYRV